MAQIPVLVACRDRLTPLLSLVAWLERAGCQRILLIDNDSVYPPLLEYFDETPHTVIKLRANVGPTHFWDHGIVSGNVRNERYIVTDPDVVPDDDCPLDAIDRFGELLDRYPNCVKVGFGLRIDDLPNRYRHADAVRAYEGAFWKDELENGVYSAAIDTTFSLYHQGVSEYLRSPAIRTGFPYVARHLPWYADLSHPTNEEAYYHRRYLRERQSTAGIRTNWNDQRLPRDIAVQLGLSAPRSRRIWARGARYVRNGFRKTGYSGY